ncbi:hypothetical protein WR25_04509 [Diploscapter pachys]|uniref:Uncharacterized protein n=1 Tax=Diploscapter pachys TaxID=2018661 RepID=A0A2A2LFZ3_9BILA|nr:hypothetical protein WR25_04509 [Diploscapter pachys]
METAKKWCSFAKKRRSSCYFKYQKYFNEISKSTDEDVELIDKKACQYILMELNEKLVNVGLDIYSDTDFEHRMKILQYQAQGSQETISDGELKEIKEIANKKIEGLNKRRKSISMPNLPKSCKDS